MLYVADYTSCLQDATAVELAIKQF